MTRVLFRWVLGLALLVSSGVLTACGDDGHTSRQEQNDNHGQDMPMNDEK